MRLLIGALLLGLAACDATGDTQKAQDPQGAETAEPATAAATPQIGKIDRSHAGQPAPDADFAAKDGRTLRISDFAGKPVLVNLWATWCAPCVAEMPALDRLAARETDRLAVLTVSQDMEGWKAVDGFFKPGRFRQLAPYLDQPNKLALALGAKGLPMTVAYDAQGRELWRVNGPLEWDGPEVAKLLDEMAVAATPRDAPDPWADARARGVDFRALGTEPGWHLEIDAGKTATLVADNGRRTLAFAAPARIVSADSAQYAMAGKDHALVVSIRKAECNDGMSDMRYPLTVEVKLDDRRYKGCGRYL